jgi:hypothetical protein
LLNGRKGFGISSEKGGSSTQESSWLAKVEGTPGEEWRLRDLAERLLLRFINDVSKDPDTVKEIVTLAPVLPIGDFRKLLDYFVDTIHRSVLNQIHMIEGLAHLVRNTSSENIDSDDLIRILEVLHIRLDSTHLQSSDQRYRLSIAISHVIDSMMDIRVEGVSREKHETIKKSLKGFQNVNDPRIVFQTFYASQALLYVPDNDTKMDKFLRRSTRVAQGVFGVIRSVKAFDVNDFIISLKDIQEGLVNAGATAEAIV